MPDTGNSKPRVNSAVVIARLLGTEGFTDHVAAQVKRYWMHRSGLTERQRKSIERLKKEFGEIMHGLGEGTQVQTDYGLFQPIARRRHGLVCGCSGVNGFRSRRHLSLFVRRCVSTGESVT